MGQGLTEKFFIGLAQGVGGDHGAHTGLGDDDHSQYLLASGTRAMAGDLDMGGFDVQNVSFVVAVDNDLRLSAINSGAAAQNIQMDTDDSAGVVRERLRIEGGSGDFRFFKIDGSTVSLLWDESDDRWEYEPDNLLFTNAGGVALDVVTGNMLMQARNGELNLRARKTGASGSNILLQTDDSGGVLRDRYRVQGSTGDQQFIKDDGATISLLWNESTDRWEFTTPVVIDQLSTTGAAPVLTLDQADVDEDFFKFIGISDTNVDRALVDAANFTTPGAIVGWLKVNVQDDQGTDPIVDGDYYVPFYAAPTA